MEINNKTSIVKPLYLADNKPLDAKTFVSTLDGIDEVLFPYVGMQIYVASEKAWFNVSSLKIGYLEYSTGTYKNEQPSGTEYVDYEIVPDLFVGSYEELQFGVQSDFDEEDPESLSYIKNKPNIFYNQDGALTGNRSVDGDGYNLEFVNINNYSITSSDQINLNAENINVQRNPVVTTVTSLAYTTSGDIQDGKNNVLITNKQAVDLIYLKSPIRKQTLAERMASIKYLNNISLQSGENPGLYIVKNNEWYYNDVKLSKAITTQYYTLTLSDISNLLYTELDVPGVEVEITIPPSVFAKDHIIDIVQMKASKVKFIAGAGVTLDVDSRYPYKRTYGRTCEVRIRFTSPTMAVITGGLE